MQITLNKTELAGALTALGKLVCRKSPLPVFHAVQIESTNNTICFRTHNSDEEIEFKIDAEGLDTFKVAMDFDLFRSLVRNSRNKSIKFEFADGALRIDDVLVVPIEGEWPVIEEPQGDSVTASPLPENFVEVMSAAAPLVDLNEPRKVLRGMNLSGDGLTATNGKELFNSPYPFKVDDLTIPFPLALMATKATGASEIRTWSTDFFTFFSAKIGQWTWTAKAILGAYPNWKRVMPNGKDLKRSVSFTVETSDRLRFFLKSVGDKRPANEIKLSRDASGSLAMRDGDGHEFGIPATFDSNWDTFSITISKEILLHLLNEGHTKLEFGDGLSPFVASGGTGQYVAMPIYTRKPQAESEQKIEQAVVQPAPEPIEQKTSSNTNIPTSTKEKITMIDTNTIHTVSAPVQTSASNHEPELNPLDELMANIEAMKTKLKAMFDESAAMSRKVREVALAQRQKEREYVQTKRTIERIRTASGF